eukprot:gene20190-31048_t
MKEGEAGILPWLVEGEERTSELVDGDLRQVVVSYDGGRVQVTVDGHRVIHARQFKVFKDVALGSERTAHEPWRLINDGSQPANIAIWRRRPPALPTGSCAQEAEKLVDQIRACITVSVPSSLAFDAVMDLDYLPTWDPDCIRCHRIVKLTSRNDVTYRATCYPGLSPREYVTQKGWAPLPDGHFVSLSHSVVHPSTPASASEFVRATSYGIGMYVHPVKGQPLESTLYYVVHVDLKTGEGESSKEVREGFVECISKKMARLSDAIVAYKEWRERQGKPWCEDESEWRRGDPLDLRECEDGVPEISLEENLGRDDVYEACNAELRALAAENCFGETGLFPELINSGSLRRKRANAWSSEALANSSVHNPPGAAGYSKSATATPTCIPLGPVRPQNGAGTSPDAAGLLGGNSASNTPFLSWGSPSNGHSLGPRETSTLSLAASSCFASSVGGGSMKAPNCKQCGQHFNLTRRRHMCRRCFAHICSACSQSRLVLGTAGKAARNVLSTEIGRYKAKVTELEVELERLRDYVSLSLDHHVIGKKATVLECDRATNRRELFLQGKHHARACAVCETPFKFFNREHHCRSCYRSVCAPCSQARLDRLRVCDWCDMTPPMVMPKCAVGHTAAMRAAEFAHAAETLWKRSEIEAPPTPQASLTYQHDSAYAGDCDSNADMPAPPPRVSCSRSDTPDSSFNGFFERKTQSA